ncbi:hypothetical protein [Devosia salina]|uniref:Flavoprotein domain-containing protein n=1 Tax=Devosia salina TaxID=2860336 RepID=A0ABX8WDS3_9HYPH|nr:hypothetical protein [Devosia salina]QYO75587.1 hypothetical protein K1X15_13200 [Devosia salina]
MKTLIIVGSVGGNPIAHLIQYALRQRELWRLLPMNWLQPTMTTAAITTAAV